MNFNTNYFTINFSISIDKLLNIWMRITYSNNIYIYIYIYIQNLSVIYPLSKRIYIRDTGKKEIS